MSPFKPLTYEAPPVGAKETIIEFTLVEQLPVDQCLKLLQRLGLSVFKKDLKELVMPSPAVVLARVGYHAKDDSLREKATRFGHIVGRIRRYLWVAPEHVSEVDRSNSSYWREVALVKTNPVHLN